MAEPVLTPRLRELDPYTDNLEAQKINRTLTNISNLSEQELIDLYNLYEKGTGSGKEFVSGASRLTTSGVTIDPAVEALQKEGIGLATKSLSDVQASRGALGAKQDFISQKTRGLRESIAQEGQALSERLKKTGVEGEFGKQTQENFKATAEQKLKTGEALAFNEFNALMRDYDLMEGGAAELVSKLDINDFAQEMQKRGMSQELVSQLTRIAQGKDALSDQKSAQNKQMIGNIAMMAAMFSDRRLKMNIKRIGKLINGINIYSYTYIWGKKAIGVMADEVLKVIPEAVHTHRSGFYMVDYSKLEKANG